MLGNISMYKKNSVTKFVTEFFGFLNNAIGFGKLFCFLKIKNRGTAPAYVSLVLPATSVQSR